MSNRITGTIHASEDPYDVHVYTRYKGKVGLVFSDTQTGEQISKGLSADQAVNLARLLLIALYQGTDDSQSAQ